MTEYKSQYTGAEIDSGIAKANTAIQDVSDKQDVLVSGTNIKTINHESLLGEGNIYVSGFPYEASELLIEILRAGVYTSDQKNNIDDLEEILGVNPQGVYFTQSGITLIGHNIEEITSITKSGTTLICV